MKKAIVLLLALGMIASFAVAQDAATPEPVAALTGYFNFQTQIGNDGLELGPDWNTEGYYSELGFAYKGAASGFTATVAFDNDAWNVGLRNIQAYVKLYDMLTVTAGKVRAAPYSLNTLIGDKFASRMMSRMMNAQYGIMFQYTGVENLDIGVAVEAYSTADGYTAAMNLNDLSKKVMYGVKYTLPETMAVYLQLKGMGYDTSNGGYEIGAAVDLLMVKGLTLRIGDKITQITNKMNHTVQLTAGTTELVMPGLELAMDAAFILNGQTEATGIQVQAKAGYALDTVLTPWVTLWTDSSLNKSPVPATSSNGFGAHLKIAPDSKGSFDIGADISLDNANTFGWKIPLTIEMSF